MRYCFRALDDRRAMGSRPIRATASLTLQSISWNLTRKAQRVGRPRQYKELEALEDVPSGAPIGEADQAVVEAAAGGVNLPDASRSVVKQEIVVLAVGKLASDDGCPRCAPICVSGEAGMKASPCRVELTRSGSRIVEKQIGVIAIGKVARNDQRPGRSPVGVIGAAGAQAVACAIKLTRSRG